MLSTFFLIRLGWWVACIFLKKHSFTFIFYTFICFVLQTLISAFFNILSFYFSISWIFFTYFAVLCRCFSVSFWFISTLYFYLYNGDFYLIFALSAPIWHFHYYYFEQTVILFCILLWPHSCLATWSIILGKSDFLFSSFVIKFSFTVN